MTASTANPSPASGRLGRIRDQMPKIRTGLALVWESSPRLFVAVLALTFVNGTLPLANLFVTKLFFDDVASMAGAAGAAGAGGDADFSKLSVLVAIYGGVLILSSLCSSLAGYLSDLQSRAVGDHVMSVLHRKAVALDLAHFEDPRFHDTFHRARTEASYRPLVLLSSLGTVLVGILSLTTIAAVLFALRWWIPPVVCLAALPGLFVSFRGSRVLYRWQMRRTPDERRASYYQWLLTAPAGAHEIRLLGLGERLARSHDETRDLLRGERNDLAARLHRASALASVFVLVAGCFLFLFTARLVTLHEITIGALAMYLQAFQRGQVALSGMAAAASRIYDGRLFLTSLVEFLALEPRLSEPASPPPVPAPTRHPIRFDHVSFRYPHSDRDSLRDVSLVIRPGERIAITGANGSGKTTLVKLLCRVYDPTDGAVSVGGVDLRQVSIGDWRKRIGVLPQDFLRFPFTVRENVAFGDVETAASPPRVETAARAAGAEEVVSRLPGGYESVLGNLFEGGHDLSAGEWQRVALARALYRECDVLVLDEPTSALDARAESELFARLKRLPADKTVILISHRATTMTFADRVCVFHEGALVESGPPEELARGNGHFARLFATQADKSGL